MQLRVPPLAPPSTDGPVDVEGRLRLLPRGALVKGVFFTSILALVPSHVDQGRLLDEAGIAARRFPQVAGFSAQAFYRLTVLVAKATWPSLPLGEGLRCIGQTLYETFAHSIGGRFIFGVLGRDADRIIPIGPKAYALSTNFGEVTGEQLAARHVRYHFIHFPGFIETLQVGVVEGALRFCSVSGRVLVGSIDKENGVLDIRWESRR